METKTEQEVKDAQLVEKMKNSEVLGYILTLFYKDSKYDDKDDAIDYPLSKAEASKFTKQWNLGCDRITIGLYITKDHYDSLTSNKLGISLYDFSKYALVPFYTEDTMAFTSKKYTI